MDYDLIKNIKAIFFDIDGTLVGFKKKIISDDTVSALNELRNRGIKLFVASGRCRSLMTNLKDYEFDGYISMNGTYATCGDKTVWKNPLEDDIVRTISRVNESKKIACVAFGESKVAINLENEISKSVNSLLKINDLEQMNMEDMLSLMPVYQATVYIGREDFIIYPAHVRERILAQSWHPSMTDINPIGISKATAVRAVSDYLGISRKETMSFGDGGNDVDMLKYTGISVAMGSAGDELKKESDYITSDADEDGVVHALKYFKLID